MRAYACFRTQANNKYNPCCCEYNFCPDGPFLVDSVNNRVSMNKSSTDIMCMLAFILVFIVYLLTLPIRLYPDLRGLCPAAFVRKLPTSQLLYCPVHLFKIN